MFNYCKWLGGLALVSLFTIGDVPGISPKKVVQAQTPMSAIANQNPANLIALHRGNGRIKVIYGETNNPFSAALMEGYQQSRFFEGITELITAQFKLPRNVRVILQDCGVANAFYSSKEHAIVMCNELTNQAYQLSKQKGYGDEAALKSAVLSTVFFFYHEAGHMLVHELDLPVVGKEEDLADQFAAYFLLSNDPSADKSLSGQILLSAAKVFARQSTRPKKGDFIDEHALNQQRYYNLVCMVYGASPEKYSGLVAKLNYPESRLNGCRQESESMFRNWERLLKPYLKQRKGW
jgi:hypothetical protein